MAIVQDFIIIGGGAAGLAAAQYAARANLSALVIEEMAHGGQALLIDKLENYPGILTEVDGYSWSEAMHRQAESFGAAFMASSVLSIVKQGEVFLVETSDGPLQARTVLLATGAKHRHAGIPGEETFAGRGVSYCATCDGPFFKGKPIVVVGGGDAACDEAMFLAKLASRVTMVHRKDRFRAQKALAARVLGNPAISVRWTSTIDEISGDKAVRQVKLRNLESGAVETLETAAVFVFVGSEPQTAALPAGVDCDESGYVVTNQRMETSLPGLFAAGDIRTTPFRQVITAVADGAVAAHCAAQYIDELQGKAYH
ncbi:MAG: thioredoxin-disulfide reductase [Spirochaetes bacterium GWD1_61_31]|nr:MAG: thioredoxin-disulfide reductase [Spirochaetes bacterium GWB1_60_80]OHD28548.1 MAG: thioredoxin-disulfide reductase [Spirochaetes bacterium GWC1_61_12]OHD42639.1 MAG: thioredoxin-disulfide reductase [Spirochaetes bacterium GWD1_61_31]OHD44542.1 MAG: thioredoxin-disulfide reductase [Spirochaetes bacterium GWE1_60_18]OHD58670.1 MAG: thioredoxin-disulfide reductase [Spirochaetes bacterium GWF1_60_12]HAP43197.1 thioredoxin-disulfide reductase [Spirochaetaceae bacterium]